MPTYNIHVVNSDFAARNEFEAEDVEDATNQGLRAALNIGTDEVCKGQSFFAAEVRVELDGKVEKRYMVGVGQSPLLSN